MWLHLPGKAARGGARTNSYYARGTTTTTTRARGAAAAAARLHAPEKAARGGGGARTKHGGIILSLLATEPTSRVDYYVSNAHAQLADTTTPNAAGMANMSPPMPCTSFMAAHVSHLACCTDLAYTQRFHCTSIS
jgi:hypothetical protein